jgi:hypothetical protein
MMLTEGEMRYIREGFRILTEEQDVTLMASCKILRTIASICDSAAEKAEWQFQDKVDANLVRNYQDLQNQKLVDLLKD